MEEECCPACGAQKKIVDIDGVQPVDLTIDVNKLNDVGEMNEPEEREITSETFNAEKVEVEEARKRLISFAFDCQQRWEKVKNLCRKEVRDNTNNKKGIPSIRSIETKIDKVLEFGASSHTFNSEKVEDQRASNEEIHNADEDRTETETYPKLTFDRHRGKVYKAHQPIPPRNEGQPPKEIEVKTCNGTKILMPFCLGAIICLGTEDWKDSFKIPGGKWMLIAVIAALNAGMFFMCIGWLLDANFPRFSKWLQRIGQCMALLGALLMQIPLLKWLSNLQN